MTRSTKNGEKGAAIILLALLLPVILGGIALVLDGGRLQARKRYYQRVVDTTAAVAAAEIKRGNNSGYKSVATEFAERNGFEEAGAREMEIHSPPTSGAYAGRAGFTEVIVRDKPQNLLMASLGAEKVSIEARAVAGPAPDDVCWTLLNPTKKDTYKGGKSQLTLDCGLAINSNHDEAARTKLPGRVRASSISIVGGYDGDFEQTPRTGVEEITDPLAMLPEVGYGGCTETERLKIEDATTLFPGVYCGGLSIKANVRVNPGTYVLRGGGLKVSKGAKLSGDDVLFYNTAGPKKLKYGPIEFKKSSLADLSGRNSGTYRGILFFQDRTVAKVKGSKFENVPGMEIDGAFYFKTSEVSFRGKGGSKGAGVVSTPLRMMLVADQVKMKMKNQEMKIETVDPSLYPPLAMSIFVVE